MIDCSGGVSLSSTADRIEAPVDSRLGVDCAALSVKPSIACGAIGPLIFVVFFFEVLSACGGSRPIATEVSTALLALSFSAIAGSAAGFPNLVVSVFEVLSAGGGS